MRNVVEVVNRGFEIGMLQVKEEALALAGFLAGLAPHNVMEIGTDRGGLFYVMSQFCTGMKISLDLPASRWAVLPAEAAQERDRGILEWAPDAILIRGDSHDQPTYDSVASRISAPLDFLFIDGDHSFAGVKDDYLKYSQFVRPGGWIGFHDINDTQEHRSRGVYVSALWTQLQGRRLEFNAKQHWAGIGLIQVPVT